MAINRVKELTLGEMGKTRGICALVTLDIRNAFRAIVRELRRRKISESLVRVVANYLSNRRTVDEGREIREFMMGVPDGI